MKQRHGFVSNSSSSSFIIGYGKVVNEKLFQEYLNHHKIEFDYDFFMFSFDRMYNETVISASNYTSLTIPEDMRNENTIVAEISNDEGDEEFVYYNRSGDFDGYDYDKAKDIDFFDEKQQAIIKLFNQPFIENGRVLFGAERNG